MRISRWSFALAWSVAGLLLTSCQKTAIDSDIYAIQRRNMVRFDLKERGVSSERVLNAMQSVPRHLFLSDQHRDDAYADQDLPISQFITTPRPFIVAKTIELLGLTGTEKVLEVGTGRGYQSALLAELAKDVYTIEIVPGVGQEAEKTLALLGFKNVHCRIGDGYKGWSEQEPFDAILVMASAKEVPEPLLKQLKTGGRLVMPIGDAEIQSLELYRKHESGLEKVSVMPIKLKPMEGRAAGRTF